MRILNPADYSQYDVSFLFSNNSFEFTTFADTMIQIIGFEIVQMLSNNFIHFGFFSESLTRSVFPIFLTPIST